MNMLNGFQLFLDDKGKSLYKTFMLIFCNHPIPVVLTTDDLKISQASDLRYIAVCMCNASRYKDFTDEQERIGHLDTVSTTLSNSRSKLCSGDSVGLQATVIDNA